MRVAVVQFRAGSDKAANRARLTGAVTRAGQLGAELVICPEAAMHGFGRPDMPLAPVAEPLDGPFVAALVAAAGQTGATVLAGMFESLPDPTRTRAYNTVVAVTGEGLIGRYRKLHLFDALGWRESDRLARADTGPDALLVVPVGGLAVGVLTCYDLRFPEICRALVDRGATALAIPAAWVAGAGKREAWLTLLRARAIENVCYLAAAAQPGPEYTGSSCVLDPSGITLALREAGEGEVIAEVDPALVPASRLRLPCLAHRRFQVVAGDPAEAAYGDPAEAASGGPGEAAYGGPGEAASGGPGEGQRGVGQ